MARSKVAGMITPEQIDTIEHAAALLDGYAITLRECHTVGGEGDWTGQDEEKAVHDDMKSTSAKLYAIADELKKPCAMRAELFLTQNALKNAHAELAKPKPRR